MCAKTDKTYFSQEELQTIIKNKDIMTVSDIAKLINRPYYKVASFLQRNKLTFKRAYNKDFLTTQEEKILKLVVGGYTKKEISKILNITENTAQQHITNIYSKVPLRKNNILNLTLWYLKYIKGFDIDFKES